VTEWLAALRDIRARARVAALIDRLRVGNFGDCKGLGGGVLELRIDYGPGYRVYFGMVGVQVVLLLCGGDKRSQNADIDRAVEYLADFQRRVEP
jgi:putative addiction module killer protein